MSFLGAAVIVSMLVPVVTAATALFLPRLRPRLPVPTGVAAAVSLATTLAHVGGASPPRGADALGMIESLALMVLIGLVVRWSPVRRAVPFAVPAGLAAAVWLLRYFTPASPLEGLGVCAFWGLGALVAAAVGGYLRFLNLRQLRAVADGRTALRLQLAGDLHDFVAHDISEMVAHAQAGQVAGDPSQALRHVEAAGQRALSTVDQFLDMLRHERPISSGVDLGDLREAAERFSAAGRAEARVRLDPSLTVPVETAALAYRIVIEGLTNVRRHAPHATRVDIDVSAVSGVLQVRMTNDGVGSAPPVRRGGATAAVPPGGDRRRGGSGLSGLAALVHAQGGELVAAPATDGWSLTARLPLAESPRWSPVSSSPTTRKASAAPSG
ncbi:sensor histidine kinase [Sphaerisporangium fuscum]|uniref:sensor histidine kinase n=1 Tax=Sphaerisporangium fuscum TaxID=2835868 RepID=UPI001BDC82C7|nr:ATP-binding protein [Sphaerisporangium fuscum]